MSSGLLGGILQHNTPQLCGSRQSCACGQESKLPVCRPCREGEQAHSENTVCVDGAVASQRWQVFLELAAISLSSLSHFPAQLKRQAGSDGRDRCRAVWSLQPTPPASPEWRKGWVKGAGVEPRLFRQRSHLLTPACPTLNFHMFGWIISILDEKQRERARNYSGWVGKAPRGKWSNENLWGFLVLKWLKGMRPAQPQFTHLCWALWLKKEKVARYYLYIKMWLFVCSLYIKCLLFKLNGQRIHRLDEASIEQNNREEVFGCEHEAP